MFRLVSVVILVLAALILVACDASNQKPGKPVRFPPKSLLDFGDAIYFGGSVVDKGHDGPVNNQISGWCFKRRMQCDTMIQFELETNVLGHQFWETIPIRKWDGSEMAADTEGKDRSQVFWYQIKVDRKTKEIAYIRVPNPNPGRAYQGMADPRTKHWRIDNGIAHRLNDEGP